MNDLPEPIRRDLHLVYPRASDFVAKSEKPTVLADVGFSRRRIGRNFETSILRPCRHSRVVAPSPVLYVDHSLCRAGSRLAPVHRRRHSGKPSQSAGERLRSKPREGRHSGVHSAAVRSLWGVWFPSDRPMPDGV